VLLQGMNFRNLRGDLFGGLTAAVVALPLALAFGVSSGAGAIAGIYGAICVGLFAALFGGTPTQVSGPTGPMTVVMAAVFTQFSAIDPVTGPAIAFTVVIMGGFFQLLFGLFRLGKYVTLMPFPVISGFMSGIGIIIITLELAPLFGFPAESSVIRSILHLPENLSQFHSGAFSLGLIALFILFAWPTVLSRIVPSPLVALIVGTLASVFIFSQDSIPVIGEIPTGLPSFVMPIIEVELLKDMLLSAIMLAALGSIDSLLTSLVADNMTKTQHDSDRELIGQGIGNMFAGMFGGLPGAGATMRTVVNIRAGGKSSLSGVVHSLVLLIIVLGAGVLAEDIPHAVLAGILIKVGIDIIDWDFLKRVHRAPPFVVLLMFLVMGLTVFVDLVTAVLVGVFLANIITIKRLSDHQVESIRLVSGQPDDLDSLTVRERELLTTAAGRILLYQIDGPVSYASVKGMTNKLRHWEDHDALLFDVSKVPFIDVSTAIAFENMILDALQENRLVYIVGINESVRHVFDRMGAVRMLPDAHFFGSRESAVVSAFQKVFQKSN